MGDHRVNLNLAIHIPVYNFRDIRAPSCPAKGRAAPGTTGHQLKGAGADLFASPRHTDNNGFAPAFMGAFQCDTHHICIADTFKAVICPAAGQLNQMGGQIARYFRWIDKVGHAKAGSPALLVII